MAVDAPLDSKFKVGNSLTGSVTIESVATRTITGFAQLPAYGLSATIGSDYAVSGGEGNVRILDNYFRNQDGVLLDFMAPADLVGPTVNGHSPEYFNLNLGHIGTYLSSTELAPQFAPATRLDLSNLRFDGDDGIEVHFQITDFSIVPEPAFGTIAVALLVLIGGRRPCR